MPLPVIVFVAPVAEDSRARALQCLGRYAARHGLKAPESLEEGPSGKPQTDTGLHLSVSHSGALWACAVHIAPLGLDIQQRRDGHNARGIAGRWFLPTEQDFLAAHPGRFFDLWCAKEAWVKYTGFGLARGFKTFSCVAEGEIVMRLAGAQLTWLDLEAGYTACLWHENGAAISVEK